MKSLPRLLITLIIGLTLTAIPAVADDMKPGKGTTVQPARATWNTGFFQEALVRKGLEELGYNVKPPKTCRTRSSTSPLPWVTSTTGPTAGSPMHDSQLPKNFYDDADVYGYVVKAGGLQGYLVSKKAVEEVQHQIAGRLQTP
jgi:glycine betaine/proline transport system substrate-binding protein